METETYISFTDLYKYFKRWAWIVIVAVCLGAIVSVVGTNFLQEDRYRSQAQLIVNQKSNQDTIQYSEIQTNVSLINTYRQIILGKSVLERVSAETNNAVTVSDLQNAVTVTQTENAQTFDIIATLDSPELAQEVVQHIIAVFSDTLQDIYDTDVLSVYVLSAPSYETNSIAASIVYNAAIGGILGGMLVVGILLLKEMLDTTVKDEEFLYQFGLVKLGELETLSEQEYKEARLTTARDDVKSKRGR